MAIKLPDPFHQILNIAYKMRGFRIMEAYIDKRDYNNVAYEGTKDLREYLELDDQDSVCDCFCKVSINGEGEKGILFEDKKTKHSRDMFTAKKQLETTHKHLIGKNKNVDYAIISNVQLESSFEARTMANYPVKVLFSAINSKQIHLENIKNLKGEKIPLLYHKG